MLPVSLGNHAEEITVLVSLTTSGRDGRTHVFGDTVLVWGTGSRLWQYLSLKNMDTSLGIFELK